MDEPSTSTKHFESGEERKISPVITSFEEKTDERGEYSHVADENFLISLQGENFPFFFQATNPSTSHSDLNPVNQDASLYTIDIDVENRHKKDIPESQDTLKEPIFEDENSLQGQSLELSSLMSSSPSRMEDFMDVVTTYRCKFCTFSCAWKTGLMSHIRNSHLDELGQMPSSTTSSLDSGESRDFDLDMTVETASTHIGCVSPTFGTDTELQMEPQDLDPVQDIFEEACSSSGKTSKKDLEKQSQFKIDKCLLKNRKMLDGEVAQSGEQHIFLCGKCSVGFTSLDLCKKHMIQHHNIIMGISNSGSKSMRKRGRPPMVKSSVPSLVSLQTEGTSSSSKKVPEEDDESIFQAKQLTRRQGRRDNMVDYNFRCSERGCSYRFKTEKSLDYHKCCHIEDPNSEDKGFVCPECLKNVFYWRVLVMHLWKDHQIDLDLHSCTNCEYKSYSMFKMDNHKRIHSEAREFVCEKCDKGFKQLSQLRNHQVMHLDRKNMSEKRWYSMQKCDICQRSFSDSKCLRKHQQAVHSKMRPYVCTYCGHMSARKAMLDLHMRQHTGEKPFFCEHCDYRTGDHNSLRRHRMRHTGDKPYKCVHCNYSCIQAISFKTHMKNKHPGLEGLYACRLCHFRSVSKENYINHMADHKRGDLPVLNEPIPIQIEDRDDPPSDENSEQSIPQLHLPEDTLQKLEDILPGNVMAAQLIYNCLNALTKEGGDLPPGVTTSSSGDGTQTITIQLPAELQEAKPDQYFLTVQRDSSPTLENCARVGTDNMLMPEATPQVMSLIRDNEEQDDLDANSFIANITMDVPEDCGVIDSSIAC